MTTEIGIEVYTCEWCGEDGEYNPADEDYPDSFHYLDNGEVVCNDCSYDAYTCYSCETVGHCDSSCWCDDCCETYCETCYHESSDHRCIRNNESIHEYSYMPDLEFHGADSTMPDLYMGVELETQGSTYDADELVRFVKNDDESHAYLKEDCSISGVEIVTHPMTLDYHRNEYNWQGLINAAETDGFHDGTGAGLHVHISRAGLAGTRAERAQVETNVLAMLEIHWDKWVELARRDDSHWAPKNLGNLTVNKTNLERGKSGGHYSALNFDNYDTLEFRMFRSTMDVDVIQATLEGVYIMAFMAKHRSLENILHTTFDDVLEQAAALNLHHLFDYFTS